MRQDLLFREACQHNKMTSLQGVCIPQYYGFFEVETASACPLSGNSINAPIIALLRVNQTKMDDPNETEAGKDYRCVDGRDDVLAISILEKLGDKIPRYPAP